MAGLAARTIRNVLREPSTSPAWEGDYSNVLENIRICEEREAIQSIWET